MFGFKKNAGAELLAALREAALRAIYCQQHRDGEPRVDINPHTEATDAYALASMLTFSRTGEPYHVGDPVHRVAHMIFAGQPERRDGRRDWVVWELNRLGQPQDAQRLADWVASEGGTRRVPS